MWNSTCEGCKGWIAEGDRIVFLPCKFPPADDPMFQKNGIIWHAACAPDIVTKEVRRRRF